ncbi:DUF930 domain-containing protein [Mesorhizobium sp. KR9-304]|uniref:DUF930 domain-containing protein n=1 Tax=Mesorhizobium sp. KR9-304 TaxID=3156614 RepID=UPI0032B34421
MLDAAHIWFHIGGMKDETEDQRLVSRWALPGSLAAHLLVAALLIFGLPLPSFEPEPEEAIAVDLVPPPEQQQAEPAPSAEEAKPEEPQQAEAEPPPPAEEAKPEEPLQAEAEPPPVAEEAKTEEPQQAEADPPPSAEEAKPEEPQQAEAEPPPPAEEAKPEEPQQAEAEPPPSAEEAKPEEPQQAETEPPPSGGDEVPPPVTVLQPVFQYGETDAGPREAPDGNSAEDGSAAPAAQPDKPEPAEQPVALTAGPAGEASPAGTPGMPAAEPSDVEKVQESVPQPKEAKKLFSREATGNPIATTAMAGVPRGVRAGRLCVTELREQLQNGLPPYYPDLLPSFRLDEGRTVIDATKAAFRMNGEWYDLSYRCEVDTNATKVTAFAFRVGAALPPSEWRRRGLPLR